MGKLLKINNKVSSLFLICSMSFMTSCSTQTIPQDAITYDSKKNGSSSSQEIKVQASGAPVTITGQKPEKSCENILSIRELYDYNANFALDPSAKPVSEEISSEFTSLNGITCVYKNLTSGAAIQLSFAKISSVSIEQLRKLLAESGQDTLTNTLEPEITIFWSEDGIGVYQSLQGNHWVSVSSSTFQTPSDAKLFVDPLLSRF